MNCIIIDDEATARNILYNLCAKVHNLNVKEQFENAHDAQLYLKTNKIDLIFLDLHMPHLSGYAFLDALKNPPKVVLTTTDRGSAIKAFEYKCIVDYLGKPFKFSRFINALDKVNRAIKINDNRPKEPIPDDLYIYFNKKLVKISIASIDVIKTHPKGIEIITVDRSYAINSSLTKILDKLPKSIFVKVHQSYIINISKIIDINHGQVIISDKSIPVSRLNKPMLMNRINLFQ